MPGQDDIGPQTSSWPSWRTSDYADSQCAPSAAGAGLQYEVGMTTESACCRLCRWRHNRHTFICRRVQLWHEQGADIDHAMLALATYVGHAKVSDTYWYLTGVPDLMVVAGRNFEGLVEPRRRQPHE
jgi:hypothetical protein